MTTLAVCMILIVALAGTAQARENRWDLSTGDTHITIGVSGDRPVIFRLQSTSGDHNWAGGGMTLPLMEKVSVAGKDTPVHWAFREGMRNKRAGLLTLVFSSDDPKLELRSIWRGRPGHGPVEHWIEIANLTGKNVTIPQQDSLTLYRLHAGRPAHLWWIRRGAANACEQGGTYADPLTPQTDLTLSSNVADGASPVPWMAVQAGDERGLYVGWEFSGLGGIRARGSETPNRLDVSIGNLPGFKTDVMPGETFIVPAAFVGCYSGDVEDGSYQLHRFILEKLRPPIPEGFPDPVINCAVYLDGGGPSGKEADLLQVAKFFADLGAELFMPDAMWFPAAGDWRWDTSRYPQGAKTIEEYVHSHGMRFGEWCAWTTGGVSDDPEALSVRGPHGHPDWFNADYPPDWQPGPYYGALACLADEDAKQWAIRKTQWLVRKHKLDYLKHDTHPIVTTCNKTDHRHSYGVDVSYWAAMGYCEVMDKLRKACPNVVLENCSGAGHIKDFAVIQRTHYTATTDTLSNLPDRTSFYDSTYAFPPLILQAYTFERYYPVKGDDPAPFLWRSAMMGAWQIAPVNSASWTEIEKESLRRSIEVYKTWIRPILKDVKVHHIFPRPDGVHWDGMFYWSPSLKRGTVYVFRPDAEESRRTVKLKGLDREANYKVWCEDGSISAGIRTGADLVDKGLAILLPKRYTSDLILVQKT